MSQNIFVYLIDNKIADRAIRVCMNQLHLNIQINFHAVLVYKFHWHQNQCRYPGTYANKKVHHKKDIER